MGFFTRESHTHFERDEEGNVIDVIRSGDEPRQGLFSRLRSRTPVSDKFEKEYYEKHPEKKLGSRLVSAGRSFDKHIVSKMQPVDMNRISRHPKKKYSVRNNYNPFGSMFDSGINYSGPNWNQSFPHTNFGKNKSKLKTMDVFDNFGYMKNRRK